MKKYEYNTHTSPDLHTFLGDSWADGGIHTDDEDRPHSDGRGNSIARSSVSDIDVDDWSLIWDAFSGGLPLKEEEYELFQDYLARECGLDETESGQVFTQVSAHPVSASDLGFL